MKSSPRIALRPRSHRLLPGALALLLLIVSCKSAEQERREEVQRIAAQHAAYMNEYQVAQAKFARDNPVPTRLEFGPDGSILVRECELQGRPGSESLRVKFTFVNSTSRTFDSAQVFITLRDPDSGTEWSEVIDVSVPFGLRFGPNSTHTSYFETPLRGIYTRPGWEWELSVQTEDYIE